MADLRNTIAHILEHEQHLADANEATIQQYVVLPTLSVSEDVGFHSCCGDFMLFDVFESLFP